MDIVHIISDSRSWWQHSWNDFILHMKEELKPLCQSGFDYHLHVCQSHSSLQAEELILRCSRFPQHLSVSEVLETFRHYVSTAVSDFIIEVLEPHWMMHTIRYDYKYTGDVEAERIYDYCHKLLWLSEQEDEIEERIPEAFITEDDLKVLERKSQIFKKAYEYLREEKVFHLDGFLRFRLKDYHEELLETIDFAIDEYVLDQEYQEFIRLLRYFISVQPSKIPLLHCLHIQDQHFHLLDAEGEHIPIEDVQEQLQEWTNQNIHPQELIISSLVTLAPQKLILHTDYPTATVIRTLSSIFEDRIKICTGCAQCCKWKKA